MQRLESKIAQLRLYIEHERAQIPGVTLSRERKSELSGESYGVDGEIASFVDRQLLYTEEGYGAWRDLEDEHLLDEVLHFLKRRA
jgi:hypothetical protein